MNWAQCSELGERVLHHSRFQWPSNGWESFNCQDGLTITDVTGGIAWLWTYPGDWILRQQPVNSFLELSPYHTGGYLSAGVSVAVFITGMSIVGTLAIALESLYSPVK